MQSHLRIGILTEDYGYGGVQRHSTGVIQALRAKGHHVEALCFRDIAPMQIAIDAGVAPVLVVTPKIFSKQTARAVSDAVQALDLDVLLCVNQAASLRAVVARTMARCKTPLLFALHTTKVPTWRGRLYLALMAVASYAARGMIFISANQQAYLAGRGFKPHRPVLIRNGLDADRFPVVSAAERREARAGFGFPDEALVLGLLGVFRPEKNHPQLIRVAAALRRSGRDVRLLLVGDGPTRAACEEQAAALGLTSEVVFAGMLSDVRPAIAALDAGVICSVAVETLSIAALEILSCGVPMLMSDIGGAREIVQDGVNGYVFNAEDDAALESAIVRFDGDDRSRLAAEAGMIVRRDFRHDDMVTKYERLFQTAAAGRPQELSAG